MPFAEWLILAERKRATLSERHRYECSEAWQVKECRTEKLFLGLQKSSLELEYRNYLRESFYSEIIEATVLMGFLGHEFEAFQLEMTKVRLGVIDSIFNTKRRQAAEQVGRSLECLRALYEAVLAPEISVELLKSLSQNARAQGCHIHPNVTTILERAEERGVRRFRRH
jgi:hypothetical protein